MSREEDEKNHTLTTHRLFAPTKDLGSVLTTFNYALYLLAYLDAKSAHWKAKGRALIGHLGHEIAPGQLLGSDLAEASPFATLGAVVSNTRATLRLFGLLPIYARWRRLSRGSKVDMDHVLRTVGMIQCSLYATFQLLENIAFLSDSGVIPQKWMVRWTHNAGGRAAAIYRLAHRAWFLGVICDFVRLFRQAQLFLWRTNVENEPVTEEDAKRAAQWCSDLIRPLAWFPIGWQLSGWSENGFPGFNLGLQGLVGVLADLRRTQGLWDATAEA